MSVETTSHLYTPFGADPPLRVPVFRALWIAAFAYNGGTWMQSVGAAWLRTSLSSSPLPVSLVQAAAAFPIFLAALSSGAMADMVDRRKLLLVTQGWMLLAAALLGGVTILGQATLALTFALHLGSKIPKVLTCTSAPC